MNYSQYDVYGAQEDRFGKVVASPNSHNLTERRIALLLHKKMDSDEEVVRKRLVKVWTQILEKYARPGMPIPPVDVLRRELLQAGVDAAVDAVIDEHWFVFSFMIRDEIQRKVENGLARFNLEEFLEDVRVAQNNPGMLNHLREKIQRYVMEDL